MAVVLKGAVDLYYYLNEEIAGEAIFKVALTYLLFILNTVNNTLTYN